MVLWYYSPLGLWYYGAMVLQDQCSEVNPSHKHTYERTHTHKSQTNTHTFPRWFKTCSRQTQASHHRAAVSSERKKELNDCLLFSFLFQMYSTITGFLLILELAFGLSSSLLLRLVKNKRKLELQAKGKQTIFLICCDDVRI